MRRFLLRLLNLVRRDRAEQELAREITPRTCTSSRTSASGAG